MSIVEREFSREFTFVEGAERTVSVGFYGAFAKRVVDIILAILALPVLVPIIAVLYILTRRDGGCGFFGHTRIGRGGVPFKCWKIRTMVPDARAALEKHLAENPEAAAEWKRDFKLEQDPRVTRLGRILRATSLDELPQIWNVLLGEMSFVGPRPVTREEMPRYSGFEHFYLATRPGITGLWQVSGRNDLSYDERVRLDASYVRNMTLAGDMGIIMRTVLAVVKRTGK
jgi:exopolysaccharide production protein ExoY